MNILHAKSPCCRAIVQRFGKRRRRCTLCHKTWRIRQKKRGRKSLRPQLNLIPAFFQKNLPPIRILAQRRDCGKDHVQIILRRSLEIFVKNQKPLWTKALNNTGQLIAITDAIWYHVGNEFYTIYTILLRPIDRHEAVICPPVVICGREDLQGWSTAVDTLPEHLKTRILALVCDGASSLMALARHRNWIVQRCHFHLIAAVQNYLTTGPRSIHQSYALYVMRVVQHLLRTNNPQTIKRLCRKLIRIHDASHSRGLRRVLRGLITDYNDYHPYLNYPMLNLPTTSNAAESWIQCIRDLMYRCRGFRSYNSLVQRITALALYKKRICCHGKLSTKLTR